MTQTNSGLFGAKCQFLAPEFLLAQALIYETSSLLLLLVWVARSSISKTLESSSSLSSTFKDLVEKETKIQVS